MNGWLVPRRGAGPVSVSLAWAPQRAVWVALALSAAGTLVCLLLALLDPRRARAKTDAAVPPDVDPPLPRRWRGPHAGPPLPWPPLLLGSAAVGVLTAIVFRPVAAVLVIAAMLVAGRLPRARWLCAAASIGALGATAAYYVLRQWRSTPAAGFGWPSRFELGHSLALATVTFLAADVALGVIGRLATREEPAPSAPIPPADRPAIERQGASALG